MKPGKKLLIACITLAAAAASASAQNQFTVDGQYRTRGEYRASAYENSDPSTGSFINERARIGIGYSSDYLTLKFSGQHCGVWGQTTQNPVNYGDFNINEAWAQIRLNDNFYTKFGRQALVYDDERILGGLDWHIAGRSHDVLKIGYISDTKVHQLDVIAAYNQNKEIKEGGNYFDAGGQPYKTMQTLWYHCQPAKEFGASLLLMNLGFETGDQSDPEITYQQTLGTYVSYKPGKLAIEGSFYYQRSGTEDPASAWMAAVKATYKTCQHASLAAGIDYLSGNKGDGKNIGFNPLYGTHHKFYGLIDYYYVNTNPTYGLIDPYLTATYNASDRLNVQLSYHGFMNDTDGGIHYATLYTTSIPAGSATEVDAKSFAASEMDLQLTWKFKKDITVMGGWSGLFRTQNNPSGLCNNQNWLWLQLNVNPQMFFANWN